MVRVEIVVAILHRGKQTDIERRNAPVCAEIPVLVANWFAFQNVGKRIFPEENTRFCCIFCLFIL